MSDSTWSPTPGFETLSFICKMAAGYVLMPDDDEANEIAQAGVRRAIDKLNTRRWNWALTYQDITFTAGTREYTLDTSFKAPRRLMILDTSSNESSRLSYLPWTTFINDILPVNSTQGTPSLYSVANANDTGTLTLEVIPSTAWVAAYPTGRLWYYRRVQYPTQASSVIAAPSEVVPYVQEFSSGFVADRYAPEKASPAYVRAAAHWREIVKDDNDIYPDWE